MLRNYSFFSRVTMLFFGITLLVAASPVSAGASLEEVADKRAWNSTMGEEMADKAELEAEFIMSEDWWNIMRPNTDGMEITVTSVIQTEEEKLLVTAFGADEEEMELLSGENAGKRAVGKAGDETQADDKTQAEEEAGAETMAGTGSGLPALDESQIAGRTLQQQEPITLSSSERDCLERIVQAESGNEDIMGKLLVANAVLNRYRSEQFPDSIEEVVTQTSYGTYGLVYQFTPAKPNGSFWSAVPSEETVEAVERALAGEDYSEGALYFASRKAANPSHMSWFDRKLTKLFKHGNHEFYK